MLRNLIAKAEKDGFELATFIGIACLGNARLMSPKASPSGSRA
jgi:hypothetical protein